MYDMEEDLGSLLQSCITAHEGMSPSAGTPGGWAPQGWWLHAGQLFSVSCSYLMLKTHFSTVVNPVAPCLNSSLLYPMFARGNKLFSVAAQISVHPPRNWLSWCLSFWFLTFLVLPHHSLLVPYLWVFFPFSAGNPTWNFPI